jgi:Arc/MetJ-type ribon-helix-helix transcriptional regulator
MYTKKISVRLSDQQDRDLTRIERELKFRTRSNLMKEALGLLIKKYPDQAAAEKEAPLFKEKTAAKKSARPTKKSQTKVRRKAK